MPSYLESLSRILRNSDTKKVKEKKEFLQNLIDILETEEARDEITENCDLENLREPDKVTWHNLFIKCHQLIREETKCSSIKSAKTVNQLQGTCCTLLSNVVRYASSPAAVYLDCNTLVSSLFEFLEDESYKNIHVIYMKIFMDYVLAIRLYRVTMKLSQWRKLLNLCINIYPQPDIDKHIIVKTVQKLVHHSYLQSQLLDDIKLMLPFLQEVFEDSIKSLVPSKDVYALIYTVCEQMATECRRSLCEFSEKIILRMPATEDDTTKYKLLLLFVMLHHPGGAIEGQESAYAHDWSEWRRIMMFLYATISKDIKTVVTSPVLARLACEIFKQLLEDPTYRTLESSSVDENLHRLKRRRLSIEFRTPIELFNIENLQDNPDSEWAIVEILTAMLDKYPRVVNLTQLPPLLDKLIQLFNEDIHNEKITNSLCKFSKVLLKTENILSGETTATRGTKKSWDKIWHIVVKILGLNQSEKHGHELMQMLIEHVGVLSINAVLGLYITNDIPWSPSSVYTLHIFCQNVTLPDYIGENTANPEDSVKIRLLKWALNISSLKAITKNTVEALCQILVGLSSKNWHKANISPTLTSGDNEWKSLNNITRCNLTLALETDLFADNQCLAKPSLNKKAMKPSFTEVALNFVIKRLCQSTCGEKITIHEIDMIIFNIALIAKFASNLLEINVESTDKRIETLTSALMTTFTTASDLIIRENLLIRKNPYLFELIRAFTILYENHYHSSIADIVVNLTMKELLQSVLALMNVENDSEPSEIHGLGIKYYEDIFELRDGCRERHRETRSAEYQEFSENSAVTIGSHRVITLFCCVDRGAEISTMQAKVLSNILQVEVYAPTVIGNLWQSLVSMRTLAACRLGFFPEETIDAVTLFLVELIRLWRHDANAILGIVECVPQFLEHVLHFPLKDHKELLKIFRFSHDLLGDNRSDHKRFGPPVYEKFLESLYKVIRIIPELEFSQVNSKITTPVTEVMLSYLDHPAFTVRLEAAKIVHFIFSSDDIAVDKKKRFFKDIHKIVFKSFDKDTEIVDELARDERTARVSTALYTFGSVIHASGLFQTLAFSSIIKLHGDMSIDINSIKKIMKIVVKDEHDRGRLIEVNLYRLISCWIQNDYTANFPWMLTPAKTEEEFYRRYIGVLILMRLADQNLMAIKTVCDNLDYSFSEIVEENFSSLITWIFAELSKTDNLEMLRYARDIMMRLTHNEGEFENVKKFSLLLTEKLADILVDIMQRLYDEEHFFEMFTIYTSLPRINLPDFNYDTVTACLQALERHVSQNEPLIGFLSHNNPDIIQKVLMILANKIHEFTMREYKIKALHQYACFCDILLKQISTPVLNDMATFIIRDVSHRMLYLIKEESNALAEIAGKFLLYFLMTALPSRSTEVSDILSSVVTNLIAVIQSGKACGIGLRILKFLIVDSVELLTESIRNLDAFPRNQSFDEIRTIYDSLRHTTNESSSLRDEIQHFLGSGQDKTITCSLEGLSHLRRELFEKNKQLNELYQDLEMLRGFAEDCSSSILHQLIYRLVKLTENSDASIALEAAKCLGELGAADLTTMILYPEEGQLSETGTTEEILTYQIIVKVVEYFFESNVKIREASADALYEICGSYWGQQILSKKYLNTRSEGPSSLRLLEYTRPFVKARGSRKTSITLHAANYQTCINSQNELWSGVGAYSYSKWITTLTCQVFDCFVNFFSTSLVPLCRLSVEFCEMILPKLIYFIICIDRRASDGIRKCLNQFFQEYFNSTNAFEYSAGLNTSRRPEAINLESVRCMLNVVNFIRIQSGDNLLLKLNYLHVAKAAQQCSAYFTSVLYAELSCEIIKNDRIKGTDSVPTVDLICENYPAEGKFLQQILREAFVQIGDPDSIHGCGLSHLKDSSSRIQHYIHLQQWDKVMISQDAELTSGYPFCRDLANALQHSGLNYLLNRFITTVKPAECMDEYLYETAWRLGDWNVVSSGSVPATNDEDLFQSVTSDSYYFFHYQALKSLHVNDNVALNDFINNARASVVKSVRNISLECSQTLYPKLVKLQMLQELEQLATSRPEDYASVIACWNMKNSQNVDDFFYVEPILSQRISMCKMKLNSTNSGLMKDTLVDTYLQLSKIAETQGYSHIAARALASLAKQENLSVEMKDQLQYQDALLAWTRQDQDIARFLLRDLINREDLNASLKTRALRIYGNWMAETKSENPQTVIDKYYRPSIKLGKQLIKESLADADNLNDSCAALAQFADAQYQQICLFMKTPQFENLKNASNPNQQSINTNTKDYDVKRAITTFQKQNSMDVTEYENILSEQKMYLTLATQFYLTTLQTGENHNFSIFRLVSLWLNNADSPELIELFKKKLYGIPSYKFIPLVPQLAPHLSDVKTTSFQQQIYELLKVCAKDHPHHTLPILFALMNTHKDYEYSESKTAKPAANERVLGATNLLKDLRSDNNIAPIIKEMQVTARALIMLAYCPFKSKTSVNIIPKSQEIIQVHHFRHSLLPTITLGIRPRGDYDGIVSIAKYEDRFEGVGGVNAPKKIVCIGTDGIRRKQLVKGKDDLRQDAVMQQVFTVMNMLLATSKATKRRKLNIRTYKIIPLSQRSGVLEWCDNTLPIICVLNDTENGLGMHKKYHPDDWAITVCRSKIQNAASQSAQTRLRVYKECCEHLQPAFQYFFMEKFPSPETWFERRLAYVRSVATTSMVGYILGLGDRHFSNILIDQTTAEVIHIDFGIAFEQGKVLPIPELIPFRLTRDMEAAMGVSGVEGVMRKCCEETMSVLRNRREIIITLLQVLLYDPLFSWSITPSKAWQRQSGNNIQRLQEENSRGSEKFNKIAERALLRVEQKLQGTEDGLITSIAGQVERLIQQARDPANLSRIFCGWQAYL